MFDLQVVQLFIAKQFYSKQFFSTVVPLFGCQYSVSVDLVVWHTTIVILKPDRQWRSSSFRGLDSKVPVSRDLFTATLTLSTPWMQARLGTIVCKFGGDRAICPREEAIFVRSRMCRAVSRDLWPWPWPWAHLGCRPLWGPSRVSLVAIEPFVW